MPDAIDTPYWNDLKNGAFKPRRYLTDAPVVLSAIGPAPVLQVSATSPALLIQVLDAAGKIVPGFDRVDSNVPFRIGPTDAVPLTLKPGTYTIVLTPIGADGKPSGDVKRHTLTIAGVVSPEPPTPQPPVEPNPPTPPTNPQQPNPLPAIVTACNGMVDLFIAAPSRPIESKKLWKGTKSLGEIMIKCGKTKGRYWWTVIGDAVADMKRMPAWNRVRDWKHVGVKTCLVCLAAGDGTWDAVKNKLPTVASSTASAKAIVASIPTDLLDMIEVELGNEPKMQKAEGDYWPGTIEEFVRLFVNPMYDVFHAAGIKCTLGGLNLGSGPADLAELLKLGAKCDKVGYHPYANDANEYGTRTAKFIDAAEGREVVESEWNTGDGPKYKAYLAWRDAGGKGDKVGVDTAEVAAGINAQLAKGAKYDHDRYYFNIEFQTRTANGPKGLIRFDRSRDDKGNEYIASGRTTELFDVLYANVFKVRA